jgi:hypothetical protein
VQHGGSFDKIFFPREAAWKIVMEDIPTSALPVEVDEFLSYNNTKPTLPTPEAEIEVRE